MTARKPKHPVLGATVSVQRDKAGKMVVQVDHETLAPSNRVRLSDPSMRPFMDELSRRIKEEPGFGRSLMHDAGILTTRGKLTKAFGG